MSSANTKYNMALIHRKQGDNNQARILFQEAAVVHAKVYVAKHGETIAALKLMIEPGKGVGWVQVWTREGMKMPSRV